MQLPDDVLRVLQGVAASQGNIRALYVFGSRADGSARPDSDLDVGVLFRSPQPLEATLRLAEILQRSTGLAVDVVDAGRAGAFLALDIVRGERIFISGEVQADEFELYVLRRAGDLLRFERARRDLLIAPPS
jgi:predicted nucleotidyltransferase